MNVFGGSQIFKCVLVFCFFFFGGGADISIFGGGVKQ